MPSKSTESREAIANELVERLYRQYFEVLFVYVNARLDNYDVSQDIVQDVFHDALNSLRESDELIRHPNQIGWLKKTAKNKILVYWRWQRRYVSRYLSLESEHFREPAAPEETGVGQCGQGPSPVEQIREVLVPEDLKLLKWLTLEKKSHLEVSQRLGITIYTSQKRLERVRKKLYKAFPEQERKKKK